MFPKKLKEREETSQKRLNVPADSQRSREGVNMIQGKTITLRRVVITGVGSVSPLGNEVATAWKNLLAGESGIGAISRFAADDPEFAARYKVPADFPVIAGEVKNFDFKELMVARKKNLDSGDLKMLKYTDLYTQYALAASLEAVNDSGLNLDAEDPERIGAIIASGMGGVSSWEEAHAKLLYEGVKRVSPFMVPRLLPNLAAGNVSIAFRAQGPNAALSTACAAGGHAIGAAFRAIQLGEADIMAAGGSEAAVTPLTISGFYRMGALATGYNDRPRMASRPFDQGHCGFVIAEGAGILILEELGRALRRGAPIYAEVVGFGMNGDGQHITDPDLSGAIRCMRRALTDAGITPTDLDYINPHATSTPTGDRNESRALRTLLGERATTTPITATKSLTGHLLGASGAVEAIFTVLSIRNSLVPPMSNLDEIDTECRGLMYVTPEPLAHPVRYALSNSFGFGGTNASLVFKRFEA